MKPPPACGGHHDEEQQGSHGQPAFVRERSSKSMGLSGAAHVRLHGDARAVETLAPF